MIEHLTLRYQVYIKQIITNTLFSWEWISIIRFENNFEELTLKAF